MKRRDALRRQQHLIHGFDVCGSRDSIGGRTGMKAGD